MMTTGSQTPLNQGGQKVIVVPASDALRLQDQNVLDFSLGRRFEAGSVTIQVDAQLFNAFNDDAHDAWETLVVAPGDSFYPDAYILPRRWSLRLGVKF